MSEKSQIEAQCGSCRGTGIYIGSTEPKGIGVVCLNCGGSGKAIIEYVPFTARQKRSDITTVRLSQGSFILTGVGSTGTEISYDDFLAGEMPQP